MHTEPPDVQLALHTDPRGTQQLVQLASDDTVMHTIARLSAEDVAVLTHPRGSFRVDWWVEHPDGSIVRLLTPKEVI